MYIYKYQIFAGPAAQRCAGAWERRTYLRSTDLSLCYKLAYSLGRTQGPLPLVHGSVLTMLVAPWAPHRAPSGAPRPTPSDQKPSEDLRFEASDFKSSPEGSPRRSRKGLGGVLSPPATPQGPSRARHGPSNAENTIRTNGFSMLFRPARRA